MDRRVSVGVGLGVVALAALIVWRGNTPRANAASMALTASTLDAATAAVGVADAAGNGNSHDNAQDAAPIVAASEFAPGTRLPDGSPVPPLPAKSPKNVRFGVVLVTYRGAQGAPANARTKAEALAMAQKLAAEAKTDFEAAVVRGDSGSIKDLGRVPRGVLEPAPEYVLFTLGTGAVSEPIDTPRGYWIVRRSE